MNKLFETKGYVCKDKDMQMVDDGMMEHSQIEWLERDLSFLLSEVTAIKQQTSDGDDGLVDAEKCQLFLKNGTDFVIGTPYLEMKKVMQDFIEHV